MDEQTKKYLGTIPRQKKLDALLDLVNDWDVDALIDWVRYKLEEQYDKLNDSDLADEYFMMFDCIIEDEMWDQGYYVDEVPAVKAVCDCPMSAFGIAHIDDCPDKK